MLKKAKCSSNSAGIGEISDRLELVDVVMDIRDIHGVYWALFTSTQFLETWDMPFWFDYL